MYILTLILKSEQLKDILNIKLSYTKGKKMNIYVFIDLIMLLNIPIKKYAIM